MLKIDVVFPCGGSVGGVENVVKLWVKYLDPDKYDLRIICLTPSTNFLGNYKKSFIIANAPKELNREYFYSAYKQFIDQTYQPDICIATLWIALVQSCADLKRDFNLPMKVVSWMHNDLTFYSDDPAQALADLMCTPHHLLINEFKVGEMLRSYPDAHPYLVSNPVEEVAIDTDPIDPWSLCYVGRIEPVKRPDLILEAMWRSKYPWKLKLIGTGTIMDSVENWIQMMKLEDRVEVMGWQEDPFACCRDSAYMIMASDIEGFPLVTIEGLCHGKTLLTTPVTGVTDYLKPGVNGYFFPRNNAIHLAKLLDGIGDGRIKRCDPQACHDSVSRYFIPEYFSNLEKVFKEIYESH